VAQADTSVAVAQALMLSAPLAVMAMVVAAAAAPTVVAFRPVQEEELVSTELGPMVPAARFLPTVRLPATAAMGVSFSTPRLPMAVGQDNPQLGH
jgi:hypothetical protein